MPRTDQAPAKRGAGRRTAAATKQAVTQMETSASAETGEAVALASLPAAASGSSARRGHKPKTGCTRETSREKQLKESMPAADGATHDMAAEVEEKKQPTASDCRAADPADPSTSTRSRQRPPRPLLSSSPLQLKPEAAAAKPEPQSSKLEDETQPSAGEESTPPSSARASTSGGSKRVTASAKAESIATHPLAAKQEVKPADPAAVSSLDDSSSAAILSAPRWPLPSLAWLYANTDPNASISRQSTATDEPHPKRSKGSKSHPRLRQQEKLMLLACAGQITCLRLDCRHEGSHPLAFSERHSILILLLRTSKAQLDVKDPDSGSSVVHLLLLEALASGERGVKSLKPDGTISADQLERFKLEPDLELLLKESKKQGFAGDAVDIEADPDVVAFTKGSLLDVKDKDGRTPLEWAVNYRRPDLVGLLLAHGASAPAKLWEKLKWDRRVKQEPVGAAPASRSASKPHPLIRHIDTSVYATAGRRDERRWGLTEGLLMEACQYKGESDEAACKRLLFQHQLLQAVDADPAGDLGAVTRLVDQWLQDEQAGHRMHPLCYRWDAFRLSPLSVACCYETTNNDILAQLLRLPHSFHVQPLKTEYPSLHLAMLAENLEGMKMLIKAGFNVNCCDVATGHSALHVALCYLELDDDADQRQLESMCKGLLNLGADFMQADDRGNNVIHYVCYLGGMLRLLRLFLARLTAMGQQSRAHEPNDFGNLPLHYAMQQSMDDEDVEVVEALMQTEGAVDAARHRNLMGLTPPQVFVCRQTDESAHNVRRLADLFRMSPAELLRQNTPSRLRMAEHREYSDVAQNQEATPMEVMSEFKMKANDMPEFKYVTAHRPTSRESRAFCDAVEQSKHCKVHQRVYGWTDGETADKSLIPLDWLQVRFTPEKGCGLYAIMTLDKSRGIEVVGELISASEQTEREKEYQLRGRLYLFNDFHVGDPFHEFAIDQSKYGNLSRFINHSCDANLQFYHECGRQRLMLYPKRLIRAGEELTFDYELYSEEAKTPSQTHSTHGRK